MPLVPLSVRKVSQVIPGRQQEGEHGVVHQVQGEHYKKSFKSLESKRVVQLVTLSHPKSKVHKPIELVQSSPE